VCVGPELVAEAEEDADADNFEVELVDERNEGIDDGKKEYLTKKKNKKKKHPRGVIYFIMCRHYRVTGGVTGSKKWGGR